MRGKISAGVLVALALLIPAAPAMADAGQPGLNAACQTVDRQEFKDVRTLITIDLDTATDVQVRVLADQILYVATSENLPTLPGAIQQKLDGSADDLRAFLKAGVLTSWTTDLRVSAVRTLTGAGVNVQRAAQQALDTGTTDALLAYLNEGLYVARALDCASASPSPSVTPSATPTATTSAAPVASATSSASPSASGGGGLPVTGSSSGTAAGIGGALLVLGGVGYALTRRRRARFVA